MSVERWQTSLSAGLRMRDRLIYGLNSQTNAGDRFSRFSIK
jgi:hypothetical protein